LRYKVEFQFSTDHWRYYTTDGTARAVPLEARPAGAQRKLSLRPILALRERSDRRYLHRHDSCPSRGTTVKYIVSAWTKLSAAMKSCQQRNLRRLWKFNNSSLATVFQYTVCTPPGATDRRYEYVRRVERDVGHNAAATDHLHIRGRKTATVQGPDTSVSYTIASRFWATAERIRGGFGSVRLGYEQRHAERL